MIVEDLTEVRLAQPAVDVRTDLHAEPGRHGYRPAEPFREVHLPVSATAEQSFDAVAQAGFRADDDLAQREQVLEGPVPARHRRRASRGRAWLQEECAFCHSEDTLQNVTIRRPVARATREENL